MELRAPPSQDISASAFGIGKAQMLACVLIGVLAGGVGGWFGGRVTAPHGPSRDAERDRNIASQLMAAGANVEAAHLYERFLDTSTGLDARARTGIALSLGQSYMDAGHYDAALRWLYEAKADDQGELADTIGKKLVHTLERMGRTHAARAALDSQTQLQPAQPARGPDDPVVAQVERADVYKSDVMRALDDLPQELAKHFAKPEDFLKQYVADEILYRKAQKLEYDKRPEVLTRVDRVARQLTVQAFMADEVVKKVAPDANDPNRTDKLQAAYSAFVEKELQQGDVKLFPERMQAPKP